MKAWHAAVGLALLGLVTYGVFTFAAMQKRARSLEVFANLEGIRTAELGQEAIFGRYLPISSRAEAEAALRGEAPRADWGALGWHPAGELRGAYWVEVSPDGSGFVAYGLVEEDGTIVTYVAPGDGGPIQRSSPGP